MNWESQQKDSILTSWSRCCCCLRVGPSSTPVPGRGGAFVFGTDGSLLLTPRIKLLLRHAMFSPLLLVGWWVARPAHMFWPCVSITQNRWPNGRRPTKHTNSHQIHMGYWGVSNDLLKIDLSWSGQGSIYYSNRAWSINERSGKKCRFGKHGYWKS